jgi:hypothetical protein
MSRVGNPSLFLRPATTRITALNSASHLPTRTRRSPGYCSEYRTARSLAVATYMTCARTQDSVPSMNFSFVARNEPGIWLNRLGAASRPVRYQSTVSEAKTQNGEGRDFPSPSFLFFGERLLISNVALAVNRDDIGPIQEYDSRVERGQLRNDEHQRGKSTVLVLNRYWRKAHLTHSTRNHSKSTKSPRRIGTLLRATHQTSRVEPGESLETKGRTVRIVVRWKELGRQADCPGAYSGTPAPRTVSIRRCGQWQDNVDGPILRHPAQLRTVEDTHSFP